MSLYPASCAKWTARLEPQPETLPSSEALPGRAFYDSLIPRLNLKEPSRRRTALDTTVSLCAIRAGNRLLLSTLHCVQRPIAVSRCTVSSLAVFATASEFLPSTAAVVYRCSP